jgi:RHS repeat-associated protein
VFEHDGFGNVLKHSRSGTWGSFVTEYTYDAGNRVSQVTASSGTQATYTRDDLGRVIGVRAIVDGQQKALISGRNYRADGLPTAQFFGNGLVESRSYDLSGRLKQINLAGEVWNHEYDWNSNLTLRQSPAGTDQFEYDELNRLDGFTLGNLSPASYTYDKNGNRLSETLNGATYQHDYFNASNRMLSRAGSPVSHDEVGNRTSHGLRALTYNSANRLYQVLEQGLVVATYVYNGLGQRVQKITNSGTTLYHYGLDGELIAETNASARLRDYLWLDGQPLALVEASGDILFLHTDHLATPRRASNANGQVVWRWDSTPFGETSPAQDPDGNGLATIVNLRFPGQYYDSESGLHYNYFRDYDPQTGRYVESDPIGLAGGLNTYGYVEGNPITFDDPLGLSKSNRGGGSNVGSNLSNTAAGRVDGLTREIQRHDPSFNYQTMRPQGRSYGREDIVALQKILQQYRVSGFCPLPRDTYTQNYLPLSAAQGRPHTVLGHDQSRKAGTYTQGAQFGSGNQFEGRWDITNHGRPQNHEFPHFHRATGPNSTE